MKNQKVEISTIKLRNTLYQLQQHSSKDHPKGQIEAPPIGITLISLQQYKNKRKVEKYSKQHSNRENIENQLKLEIFKKIKETMNSGNAHSGLDIVRATMHFNEKTKPNTSEWQSRRKKILSQRNIQTKNLKPKCFRLRTENTTAYRPYQSFSQYYHPTNRHKKGISERKFQTERSYELKGQSELNGWNISNEEQDFLM